MASGYSTSSPSPYGHYVVPGFGLAASPTYQLQQLAKAKQKRHKPPKPVDRDAPVYGWRGYGLSPDGELSGARVVWKSAEMEATCDNGQMVQPRQLIETLRQTMGITVPDEVAKFWEESIEADTSGRERCLEHLQRGHCVSEPGCGIWARPEPQTAAVVSARCVAWGTVLMDEDGAWRASDVRIEEIAINQYMLGVDLMPAVFRYLDWERMAYDMNLRYGVPVKLIKDSSEWADV